MRLNNQPSFSRDIEKCMWLPIIFLKEVGFIRRLGPMNIFNLKTIEFQLLDILDEKMPKSQYASYQTEKNELNRGSVDGCLGFQQHCWCFQHVLFFFCYLPAVLCWQLIWAKSASLLQLHSSPSSPSSSMSVCAVTVDFGLLLNYSLFLIILWLCV